MSTLAYGIEQPEDKILLASLGMVVSLSLALCCELRGCSISNLTSAKINIPVGKWRGGCMHIVDSWVSFMLTCVIDSLGKTALQNDDIGGLGSEIWSKLCQISYLFIGLFVLAVPEYQCTFSVILMSNQDYLLIKVHMNWYLTHRVMDECYKYSSI